MSGTAASTKLKSRRPAAPTRRHSTSDRHTTSRTSTVQNSGATPTRRYDRLTAAHVASSSPRPAYVTTSDGTVCQLGVKSWLYCSRICEAKLPWNPQIWCTGPGSTSSMCLLWMMTYSTAVWQRTPDHANSHASLRRSALRSSLEEESPLPSLPGNSTKIPTKKSASALTADPANAPSHRATFTGHCRPHGTPFRTSASRHTATLPTSAAANQRRNAESKMRRISRRSSSLRCRSVRRSSASASASLSSLASPPPPRTCVCPDTTTRAGAPGAAAAANTAAIFSPPFLVHPTRGVWVSPPLLRFSSPSMKYRYCS
eukprot:Rhum_TRINITY_DN15047_c1_g1::Rhum_TRINITY_DN15047_c1_g1_i1::g.136022::m.136022